VFVCRGHRRRVGGAQAEQHRRDTSHYEPLARLALRKLPHSIVHLVRVHGPRHEAADATPVPAAPASAYRHREPRRRKRSWLPARRKTKQPFAPARACQGRPPPRATVRSPYATAHAAPRAPSARHRAQTPRRRRRLAGGGVRPCDRGVRGQGVRGWRQDRPCSSCASSCAYSCASARPVRQWRLCHFELGESFEVLCPLGSAQPCHPSQHGPAGAFISTYTLMPRAQAAAAAAAHVVVTATTFRAAASDRGLLGHDEEEAVD